MLHAAQTSSQEALTVQEEHLGVVRQSPGIAGMAFIRGMAFVRGMDSVPGRDPIEVCTGKQSSAL